MSNGNDDWGNGEDDGGWGTAPLPDEQLDEAGDASGNWGELPPAQAEHAEPDAWGEPAAAQPQGPGGAPQQPSQAPQGHMVHDPSSKSKGIGFEDLDTNDVIALVASFLLPGVGHIILGQTMRGLAILALVFFTCGIGYVVSLLVVADCYFVAKTQKYREVGDWEFFPDYKDHI